ncbi:MAG: hypothetical protein AAGC55_33495 [Myxococcota bacterium]
MSEYIQTLKEWVRSLRQDIEAVKTVLETEAIGKSGRKFAAAALNYMVTRMDLVPDWNETIGVIDDTMVMRVCMRLANAYEVGAHLDGDALLRVSHMSSDVEHIELILGDELYSRFRKYCARLSDTVVRGRSPEHLVSEADARAALYRELEEDLLRMPPASFDQGEDLTVHLTSYLHHKLT